MRLGVFGGTIPASHLDSTQQSRGNAMWRDRLRTGICRVAAVLGSIAFVALIPPASDAQVPQPISCEQLGREYSTLDAWLGSHGSLSLASNKLAWGRPMRAFFVDEAKWLGLDENLSLHSQRVFLEAANAKKPIRRTFSTRPTSDGQKIVLYKGDGAAKLTATWVQTYKNIMVSPKSNYTDRQLYPEISCVGEESIIVKPVAGLTPGFSGWPQYFGVSGSERLRIHDDRHWLCRNSKRRSQSAWGTMTIRVRGAGGKAKLPMGQLCGKSAFGKKETKNWKLVVSGSYVFIQPKAKKPGVRSVKFLVTLKSKKLLSGSLRMKTTKTRLRKIWESTDAFVNVCINQGMSIYSQGGRLYCEVGGRTWTEVKKTSWKARKS